MAGPSEEGVQGRERSGEPVVQVAGAELARHTGLNTSLIRDTAHRLLAVSTRSVGRTGQRGVWKCKRALNAELNLLATAVK